MRTNKFLLIALAAAGMFTACSNDDEVVKMNQGNEISFRVQGGTPSLRTTVTTLATVDAFVVFGNDNKSDITNMFNGTTVARQVTPGTLDPTKPTTGDNIFAYAPNRYYHKDATRATYMAYSPASAVFESITIPADIFTPNCVFEYTVPGIDDSGNTKQMDLLFATYYASSLETNIDFTFTHALSRVFVSAENKTPDPVIINKIKFTDLYSTGEIAVNGSDGNWGWGNHSAPADYEYEIANSGIAVPGNVGFMRVIAVEQSMMVLPQTPDAGVLEIEYEFRNLGTSTKRLDISGTTFEKNKQYQINITFDAGAAITFEVVEVEDFTNAPEVTPPPVLP